jgi:hypothetical protein
MSQQHKIGTVATTISTSNGITRVCYHSTDVVSFDSKSITLQTGGWWTATTKTRMNQAASQFDLNFSVSQKKGVWYVITPKGETIRFDHEPLTFKRGK